MREHHLFPPIYTIQISNCRNSILNLHPSTDRRCPPLLRPHPPFWIILSMYKLISIISSSFIFYPGEGHAWHSAETSVFKGSQLYMWPWVKWKLNRKWAGHNMCMLATTLVTCFHQLPIGPYIQSRAGRFLDKMQHHGCESLQGPRCTMVHSLISHCYQPLQPWATSWSHNYRRPLLSYPAMHSCGGFQKIIMGRPVIIFLEAPNYGWITRQRSSIIMRPRCSSGLQGPVAMTINYLGHVGS